MRDCIDRGVAMARNDHVVVADLPEKIRSCRRSHILAVRDDPNDLVPMEEVERRYALRVLEDVQGSKAAATRVHG